MSKKKYKTRPTFLAFLCLVSNAFLRMGCIFPGVSKLDDSWIRSAEETLKESVHLGKIKAPLYYLDASFLTASICC